MMKAVKYLFYGLLLMSLILGLLSPMIPIHASSTTVTLNAIADTYTFESQSSKNYGSSGTLVTGNNCPYRKYIFIKFNLSSIPPNSVILSATLRLYQTNQIDATVSVYRVLGDWSEMELTWSNKPGHETPAIDQVSTSSAGWYEWNVTSVVQAWVDGTYNNYGFMLLTNNMNDHYFKSREASENQPELVIEYLPPNTITYTVTETETQTIEQTVTETETVTETFTETTTITETETITETTTIAETTITETETLTETVTETFTDTQTVTDIQTTTQTINNTIYSTVTTTITMPTTYTATYTTTINQMITSTYGNETANYYVDLTNQLVPLIMVIGVICSLLGLVLSSTKG